MAWTRSSDRPAPIERRVPAANQIERVNALSAAALCHLGRQARARNATMNPTDPANAPGRYFSQA